MSLVTAELNVTERPWVERHLRRPGIMASSPRKRPLIYIYDLPAEFNTRMHQYRLDKVSLSTLLSKMICVYLMFGHPGAIFSHAMSAKGLLCAVLCSIHAHGDCSVSTVMCLTSTAGRMLLRWPFMKPCSRQAAPSCLTLHRMRIEK